MGGRQGIIAFRGNPLPPIDPELKVGEKSPDVDSALSALNRIE